MTLFEEIVNESFLLNELSQGNDKNIIAAINGMRRVRLVYDDGQPRKGKRGRKGKAERNFFPIVYGKLNGSGNIAVAGYEAVGSTKRGLVKTEENPQGNRWKVFLLKNIVSWTNSSNKFDETNFTDPVAANNFNPNGDKRFSEIFEISPIVAGYDDELSNPNKPIDDKPIQKKDIEPQIKTKVEFQPKRVQPVEKEPQQVQTQQNTIDNNQEKDYNVNSIEAPEARPVTKAEIDGGEQSTTTDVGKTSLDAREDKPVTKDEIENPADNDATDLMRRMGLLPNENNDEEEEEAY